MPFDYSKSGLPDKPVWQVAVAVCHQWLTENMSMFGPERIESFMQHQPLQAARLIIDNCPDYSEGSITLVLLGPNKGILQSGGDAESENVSRKIYGDGAVDLLKAMAGETAPTADQIRDMNRIFLVEGLSGMNDQIIGRKHIDKHHQVRWNMLKSYEEGFSQIKGQNPGLDAIFEADLVKSRAALEALDKAGPAAKKAFKPPHM